MTSPLVMAPLRYATATIDADGCVSVPTVKRVRYGGEELTDCVQSWLQKNCVNGAFNLIDGTKSFAQFEQVRIPLLDEKGQAMDARAFATRLRKHLQQPPYNITSKVIIRGLGEAVLILGEK